MKQNTTRQRPLFIATVIPITIIIETTSQLHELKSRNPSVRLMTLTQYNQYTMRHNNFTEEMGF
jgi:hypothetical protein